jgi:ubiquinone/menaquinone biosynthesis C-methylase UbiE
MEGTTKIPIDSTYLDVQAEVGITKHIGGFDATDSLLALCHVETAHEVLYVGCGVGVGPIYIARKFNCRVTGVDISVKMLEWSRQRAREEHMEHKVDFRTGNILALPFESGRFDAVIVESVAVFVEDKALAIRECARVTRPGGYIGLNEVCWIKPASDEMNSSARREMGAAPIPLETWQSLWDGSGLADRLVKVCTIDTRAELHGRVRWVGLRWSLRAIGRLLTLYISNPGIRQAIRAQWSGTLDKTSSMGYLLLVGRK